MKMTLALTATSALLLAASPALAQLDPVGHPVSGAPGAASQATGQVAGQLPSLAAPPTMPKAPKADAEPSTSVSGAASAQTSGANTSVTTGMAVRDKTGATIGEVAGVKTGADGKSMATIQMGADTFAVDASALAVVNGAATVNASQDEIKLMLKK